MISASKKKLLSLSIVAVLLITVLSQCKTREEAKTDDKTNTVDTTSAINTGADTAKASPTPLTLIIENLSSSTAPVIVGVYGTKNKFPDPKDQMTQYKFTPKGKVLTAEITDLKFGTYALAIYQDVNSSGKIDKNFIGIPTEGYAFSNNYKPTVKAPAFDDCRFNYNAKQNTVTMKIIR